MTIERRETAPHTAVLFIKYEIHEKMPSGELRGMPVEKGERIVKVEGVDRPLCKRKLQDLLERLAHES